MTPEQIALVEQTAAILEPDLDAVADDFSRTLLSADPSLRPLPTGDLATQRATFVAELTAIVASLRHLDTFLERTHALGSSPAARGLSAANYRTIGVALLDALARALGEAWTPEVSEAWRLASNLTAEATMAATAATPIN